MKSEYRVDANTFLSSRTEQKFTLKTMNTCHHKTIQYNILNSLKSSFEKKNEYSHFVGLDSNVDHAKFNVRSNVII